jgi:hypothetical protein
MSALVDRADAAYASAATVGDLAVVSATESSVTLEWTDVDDGRGNPAWYRLRYAEPPIDWGQATIGCAPTLEGREIGSTMSCVVTGLKPTTEYDFQVMSYRMEEGVWQGAQYSNVATGATGAPTTGTADFTMAGRGIWIGPAELAALTTSGTAWERLKAAADGTCGTVRLNDQEQKNNVCIMAKALVFARTGIEHYRAGVIDAVRQIADGPRYRGRALALGRELPAYVIAADLVELARFDPGLDADFRDKLRELLTTHTDSGPASLVECHERRPNNWGTHCGAARAAVAAYLGDKAELARTAQVFRGWLGERDAYAGFRYGDLSWQCDPSRPVGINPAGCMRDGHPIGGVLPDDQRRAGGFHWPAPKENYVWEGLQGALVQAVILERAGYPAFEWGDRALLRAARWLHEQASYPAAGDDIWQEHILNHYYGASFPAVVSGNPGKNVGWTAWTHRW